MKEKLLQLSSYLLVAVAATLVTLTLTDRQVSAESGKLDQLQALIEEKFIGEADVQTITDAAADAMVAATGDRWSYYIPASEMEAHQEQMENAYVGVGITIRKRDGDTGFDIVEVLEGGPAREAGLEPEDILVAVEHQDVCAMDTEQVRDLVRGPEGTFLELTVLRDGEELVVSVERRVVQTAVALGEMLTEDTGLVTIKNFDERCARETIAVMEALLEQGAEKLIFDVRYNPGGYADEMVDVLDYLLPEGELFRGVYYDGREYDIKDSDADCLDIPMAVLVNAGSYSAAEFFAAALQDYDAAVVLGEQTVGKGYFQITYPLSDGSAVALSVGEYFTPSGKNLAQVGVTPDILVPMDEQASVDLYYGQLEPEADPQIQAALDALK